jgi:hypothetical protein
MLLNDNCLEKKEVLYYLLSHSSQYNIAQGIVAEGTTLKEKERG